MDIFVFEVVIIDTVVGFNALVAYCVVLVAFFVVNVVILFVKAASMAVFFVFLGDHVIFIGNVALGDVAALVFVADVDVLYVL